MVALDQIKYELNQYAAPLKEVGESLDLEKKGFRVEEIEGIMEEEGFWNDADKAQNYMKELKNLKDTIQEYRDLETQFKDLYDLIDMVNEENDESMVPEVQAEFEKFTNNFEEVRLATLLDGEFDKNNAIVTLHAGAGGTEACDWCSMLYRMYSMWAQSKGFSLELLDFLEGDEAGYKSVTLQINGMNAYGHLKSEHGVHRLVRISPFNAQAKRQTSFSGWDSYQGSQSQDKSATIIGKIRKWFHLDREDSGYNKNPHFRSTSTHQADWDYNAQKKRDEAEIDAILDKIRRSGYASLSAEEKKKLFEASKS